MSKMPSFPSQIKMRFFQKAKDDMEALNICSFHLLLLFTSYWAVAVINMLKRNFM